MMRPRVLLVGALFGGALAAACGGKDDSEQTATHTTRTVEPDASWVDDGVVPALPEDAGADVDASTCPLEVVDLPSGTWMPRKPPRDATACGAGETGTVITSCEFAKSQCASLAASYVPCFYCIYSRETEATYGMRTFVAAAQRERINYRGYVLRTGGTAACGERLEDYAACLDAACACASEGRRAACVTRAKTGACKNIAVGTACIGQDAAKLLQPIVERGDFANATEATTIAKAFCGGS